jgi:molecular chaperone GrpE (heat shock protein)
MTNPSENEKEKILDRISFLKEEIWETRAYISSDICQRCSDMYDKILRLEQELKGLQRKLEKDERA